MVDCHNLIQSCAQQCHCSTDELSRANCRAII